MYWLWALYQGNLDLFRQDLTRWRVLPAAGDEEQAEVLNKILPIMIDNLTDEQLQKVLDAVIEDRN